MEDLLPALPRGLASSGEEILKAIGTPEAPGRVDPIVLTREQRRAAVSVLVASGWRNSDIARRLKVSVGTISQDVSHIKAEAGLSFSRTTINEIVGHFNLRYEHLYRQVMRILDSPEELTTKEKLNIIKEAVSIQEAQLKVLKDLGVKLPDGHADNDAETAQRILVVVQRLMVVIEKHVGEEERRALADDMKRVLDDVQYRMLPGPGGD